MSKVFAKYTVVGNEEDLVAFEVALAHIDWCQMNGSSRDVTICVDGDGSANIRFFRDKKVTLAKNDTAECRKVKYPKKITSKMFNGEKINLDVGTIEANGDGKYYIGE